jgi:hypothetical protein
MVQQDTATLDSLINCALEINRMPAFRKFAPDAGSTAKDGDFLCIGCRGTDNEPCSHFNENDDDVFGIVREMDVGIWGQVDERPSFSNASANRIRLPAS